MPEYTAVSVLVPGASSEALSGRLAADSVALVGSSVCVDSKLELSTMFAVPLGTPPPPVLAETVTVRVVACPAPRLFIPELRSAINVLAIPVTS